MDMKTIKIKDKNLIKSLKLIADSIDAARVGMTFHAGETQRLHEKLFKVLREWMPETKGWAVTLDHEKNEVKFLERDDSDILSGN